MKRISIAIAIAFIGITSCKTNVSSSKGDPRLNPETAVADMINLLENKQYKQFIKNYFDPETLQRVLSMYSIDDFVENFASKDSKNIEKILAALKNAQKIKPELNDEKTEARYSKDKINSERDLALKKLGEYWYLKS